MSKEEAIERLKQLCENDYGEYIKSGWLGISNILAIETVLSEVERLQEYETYLYKCKYLCVQAKDFKKTKNKGDEFDD